MRRQQPSDRSAVVLKDPTNDRFYRFREVESFILEQLDGRTRPEQIRTATEKAFGAALSVETLDQFLRRLDSLGLTEGGGRLAAADPSQGRRVRGDAFYLRFRAFNPDQLFGRWARRLRFLFGANFLLLSAATVMLSTGVTLVNWPEIVREFRSMFHLQSLLLAWATVIVVILAHECAHGLTCKHFGGSVQELGCILIYFQPTFFCNISDAWLFPEKVKRLWVSFAGAYFEIFLWALATLVWRVTEPHTVFNYMALVVMATSGIRTLFNLNPLIKLDGYYLLSDYLEIPNLRWKAFRFLREQIGRVFGATVGRLGQTTRRQRWIYLSYGLLAAVYSYGLFGLFLMHFSRFLVGRYQGGGFVLVVLLLLLTFRHPLRRFRRVLASFFATRSAIKPAVKKASRLLAFLVSALAFLYFCRLELKVPGEFIILPAANAEVRAEVEGLIQEVAVAEGDFVNKGDVLVRLSSRGYPCPISRSSKPRWMRSRPNFGCSRPGRGPRSSIWPARQSLKQKNGSNTDIANC